MINHTQEFFTFFIDTFSSGDMLSSTFKTFDLRDIQNSSGETKDSRWPKDKSNSLNLIFFLLALDRFRRQMNSSSNSCVLHDTN